MNADYDRVAAAIRFIGEGVHQQPSLDEVASAVGLSPFHFQRLFRRWAGVSPKRFLQFLTVEHAKRTLEGSASVLDAAYAVGLSGPGRLHDHFVSLEAVTPGEHAAGGAGVEIRYAVHDGPFGPALLAATGRGICALSFLADRSVAEATDEVRRAWPRATLVEDCAATAGAAERIFDGAAGPREPIALDVRGTNFQINVWKALLRIPVGSVTTYARIARRVAAPSAARAVGRAVGANPVAYLIPCHRVIRATGDLGGYRWGAARKQAMLAREAAQAATWAPVGP